jgi:hypothetical protein
MSIIQFLALLEGLLRSGFRQALRILASGKAFGTTEFWEELILSDVDHTALKQPGDSLDAEGELTPLTERSTEPKR